MDDTTDTLEDALESRANELYWASDRSVNWIAEDLDLSRGALYALIHPLEAGLPCPACEAELQYANRTARDRHLLTCGSCGLEEVEDVVRAAWRERARTSPSGAVVVDGAPAGEGRVAGRNPVSPWDNRVFLGAMLLGAAAALFVAFRRRRD